MLFATFTDCTLRAPSVLALDPRPRAAMLGFAAYRISRHHVEAWHVGRLVRAAQGKGATRDATGIPGERA